MKLLKQVAVQNVVQNQYQLQPHNLPLLQSEDMHLKSQEGVTRKGEIISKKVSWDEAKLKKNGGVFL